MMIGTNCSKNKQKRGRSKEGIAEIECLMKGKKQKTKGRKEYRQNYSVVKARAEGSPQPCQR